MDLLDRFLDFARSECGYDPAERVVVAFSGGPDSSALLDLHVRAGNAPERIIAVHLDHGLRVGSEHEAIVAAERARRSGARVVVRRAKVSDMTHGRGVEAAGRDARYRLLGCVAREHGISHIATGHHRDDREETILLRILRGAGPRGLAGLPVRRPLGDAIVVRPLASFSRAEIHAYLASRGIESIDDPSNFDDSNLRSRVRHRLLPTLEGSKPALLELGAAAARLNRVIASQARRIRGTRSLSERPLLLGEFLRQGRPTGAPLPDRGAVDRVAAILAAGRGETDFGAGWRVKAVSGDIEFLPPSPASPAPCLQPTTLNCPGRITIPGGRELEASVATDRVLSRNRDREIIDALSTPPPFLVRPAEAGDRFRPLGLGAETTVFRFLMGRKVPGDERSATPVVLSRETLVWVVGHRLDERAGITERTSEAIALEYR